MRNCADAQVRLKADPTADCRRTLAAVLVVAICAAHVSAQPSNATRLFKDAQAREAELRRDIDTRKAGAQATPLLQRARTLVGAFEDISRLFPLNAEADASLWHGASLAADAFWEFGQPDDRATALRLLKSIENLYPASTYLKQAATQEDRLNAAKVSRPAPVLAANTAAAKSTPVTLTTIRRESLPGAMRITLGLEGEALYRDEEIAGPPRVFIDLQNTRPVEALKDVTQTFADDLVRQIRVGRPLGTKTRVVLDLTNSAPHTVYALYNPYRVVIDFAREAPAPAATAPPVVVARESTPVPEVQPRPQPTSSSPEPAAAPLPPSVNGRGGFSLSRQLGLGVARIVIDPGHGGHDPGAMNNGLTEADLVLDVGFRLEKLLLAQPGVEVVMTRRTNVFVPLEERTAIANRAAADLFLSIHANASQDERARGIETYFLNFAPNPAAEAIAARENAASARTMRQLPDIVKAIALNNKIDESRDFASLVQSSMLDRLKRSNRTVKDLGVKQAPFMVLIGATMPSILAEISFLTNRQESTLLRGNAYRQQIAEALFNGLMRYQRSLKAAPQTVASQ